MKLWAQEAPNGWRAQLRDCSVRFLGSSQSRGAVGSNVGQAKRTASTYFNLVASDKTAGLERPDTAKRWVSDVGIQGSAFVKSGGMKTRRNASQAGRLDTSRRTTCSGSRAAGQGDRYVVPVTAAKGAGGVVAERG
jgi:hypothetical protein